MTRPSAVFAIACVRFESSQPVSVSAANLSWSALSARTWPTACRSAYVSSRSIAWLQYHDAVASRRPPLFPDHITYPAVVYGSNGIPSSSMGADRQKHKPAGGLVYYALALGGLRARATSELRMLHACVRRITLGASSRDKIIHPLNVLSRGYYRHCLDYLRRVDTNHAQACG